MLAEDRVRFVGEPVALIIADTIQDAKDASELIEVDYEDLPVSTNLEAGENSIHQEAPGNVAFEWQIGDEKRTNAIFEKANKVVQWKSQITELLLIQWSLGVVMLNGIKIGYIFL